MDHKIWALYFVIKSDGILGKGKTDSKHMLVFK